MIYKIAQYISLYRDSDVSIYVILKIKEQIYFFGWYENEIANNIYLNWGFSGQSNKSILLPW